MNDLFALERLLVQQAVAARGNGRDWWTVIEQFRRKLTEIYNHPKIIHDAECARLLEAMGEAADMTELAPLVDDLAQRVALLFEPDAATASHLARPAGRTGLRSMHRFSATAEPGQADGDQRETPRPGRSRLRL